MDRSQLLSELSAALEAEIDELKSEGQFQIVVYDGRFERESGGKYEYYFRLDRIGEFPDDVPVSVKVGEKNTRGAVLSVEGLDLFLALDDNIGLSIATATLESAPYFLLEMALEKLLDLPDTALPRKLFGIDELSKPKRRKASSTPTSGGIVPNQRQRAAIELAAGSQILYLWGPPGTGKTTTIGWIVEALRAQNHRCLILANTNVATDKALLDTATLLKTSTDVSGGRFIRWGAMRVEHPMAEKVDVDRIAERKGAALRERLNVLDNESATLAKETARVRRFSGLLEEIMEIRRRRDRVSSSLNGERKSERSLATNAATATAEAKEVTAKIDEASKMSRLRRMITRVDLHRMSRHLDAIHSALDELARQQVAHRAQIHDLQAELKTLDDALRAAQTRFAESGLPEDAVNVQLGKCNQRFDAIRAERAQLKAQLTEIRKSILQDAVVVATTLARCYSSDDLFAERFDALIVDEASMAPLPMLFIDSHLAAKKIIVVGDFKQLSPIARSNHDSVTRWLKRNIFEVHGFDLAVTSGQLPMGMVQLIEQHRMHPAISRIANKFVYGNTLVDGGGAAAKGQEWRDSEPGSGAAVAVYDTSALNPWCGRTRNLSRFNIYSALIAASMVKEAKESACLKNEDIAVITPYRAQADLIAKCLEDGFGDWTRLRGVGISTVHRFQGHERQLVIFDVTDGPPYRPGRLLDDGAEGGDDERLINVALTRAQGRLILLANLGYVEHHHGKTSLLRNVLQHASAEGGRRDAGQWIKSLTAGDAASELLVDLSSARKEVVFVAPRPTAIAKEAITAMHKLHSRGVKIAVLTGDTRRVTGLPDGVRALRIRAGNGYRVNQGEVLTIIDKRISWIGTGLLTARTSDLIVRVVGLRTAEELLRIYSVSQMVAVNDVMDALSSANVRFKALCEECGSAAVIKRARTGRFFVSCSAYPRCTWSRFLTRDDVVACREAPECPQDHGQLELKQSFKNRSFFWGCPDYPECRETRPAFG